MVVIHQVEQNTPEWFALREECDSTASSAYELLKTGKVTKKPAFAGNYHTKRGHILESEALELVHAILGTQSTPHGFVTNSKYPRAGASPDDLTTDIYMEVKCFNEARHKACAKDPFPEIVAQIEYGKLITEYRKALLILYNPDLPAEEALVLIWIKPNRAIQNNLKKKLLA